MTLLASSIEAKTLADIAELDFVELSPTSDLVVALVAMEKSDLGAVFYTEPGGLTQFLHKDHCSQLLTAALQGYPVPRLLADATTPIVHVDSSLSVLDALPILSEHQHVAICQRDRMIGYLGPAQWMRYTQGLLSKPEPEPFVERSLFDPLTGLPDFRAYRMHLEMSLIEYFEQGRECSLVLFEMDWRHGMMQFHSIDEEQATLQRVTQTMLSNLRDDDQLFALEPGKWGLVIRDHSQHVARSIAQRIRSAVFEAQFANHGSPLGRVSLSAGLTGPNADADTVENEAEEVLEQAIMSGGHQVLVTGERLI